MHSPVSFCRKVTPALLACALGLFSGSVIAAEKQAFFDIAIDRLAKDGTRFARFYATGTTCCSAHTGLMTSR